MSLPKLPNNPSSTIKEIAPTQIPKIYKEYKPYKLPTPKSPKIGKDIIQSISNSLIKNINKYNFIIGEIHNKVDKVNEAISENNINSSILKNGCIQQINNTLSLLNQISNNINNINSIINIFSLITNMLENIPIPLSVPPGVGVPMNVVNKINSIITKSKKVINSLGVVIDIINNVLNDTIEKIKYEESRLLNGGNELLDIKLGEVPNYTYKGFRFFIKEENTYKQKRHYASAVDENGVEKLISDYSFTLEPNVLIELLKNKIDELGL